MDGTRFDDLAQRLAQTRITRLDALRGLVASAVVGLTAVSLTPDETEARKKGKARKARKQKKGGKGNGGGTGNGNGNGGGGNGNGDGGNGNGNGNEEKFQICHCPPGNPDNCHTISVGSQSAVDAHLANHPDDSEGECEDTPAPVCDEELPEGCEYLPEDEQTDPAGCLFECTSGAVLNFGPNGWAGWSCPADTTVVSGRHDLEDAAISKAANPEDDQYPAYPHYTFDEAAGEEGWVVQNDNDSESGRTIWVTCLAA